MARIPSDNKTRLQLLGLAVFLIFIGWYALIGSQRNVQWDGEGVVNVFAEKDSSKNYRLDAMIEITIIKKTVFSNQREFNVTSITWPDGGRQYFENDCTSSESKSSTICKTENGDSYYVEVDKAPTRN